MSFLGLPELQPARYTKNELAKLINRITTKLNGYIAFAPLTCAISELIDLATVVTVEVVPPRQGWFFVSLAAGFRHAVTEGAAITPPTLQSGNDATVTNVVPAAAVPTVASFATGAPFFSLLTLATNVTLVDMSTPILAAVTVGATGGVGFSWKGRVEISGYYVSP